MYVSATRKEKLTADDRLILVRVKIERAKKHLRDLETELIAFRDEHLNVIVSQKDANAGQCDRPPIHLPKLPWNAVATAGDIVHNLRSALDHLAYQLAVVGIGNPNVEPSRTVEFPIAKDAATCEANKARKVKGMRPEAVRTIDALKPYKG